jgi:hypothetical protein
MSEILQFCGSLERSAIAVALAGLFTQLSASVRYPSYNVVVGLLGICAARLCRSAAVDDDAVDPSPGTRGDSVPPADATLAYVGIALASAACDVAFVAMWAADLATTPAFLFFFLVALIAKGLSVVHGSSLGAILASSADERKYRPGGDGAGVDGGEDDVVAEGGGGAGGGGS